MNKMIYITGDTHGNIDFNKLKNYFSKRYVTHKDYLIILGDAGIVWSEEDCYIHDYNYLGLTVLFIDGNHENFELLDKFPIIEYKGAKCHRLARNVFHITRGEIIYLNGISFFCMGGATSIDKAYRINRISWWAEENISTKDILNGLDNLQKIDFKVDYVLSHSAPSFVARKMFGYNADPNADILEKFQSQIDFKYWYFGHYHENKKWNKYRCFYGDILEIPIMDEGKKSIPYKLLTRSSDYDDNWHFPYLINRHTGRKTNLKEEDLPEWFYHDFEYRDWYYCLKGVMDVAFIGSPFDNHISKDSRIYLHYHGKLKKTKKLEPFNKEEWDESTWRCNIKHFCMGLEKYSPHLNLKPLKARINLVYDQYNNRREFIDFDREDIVVRPFPEIDTPHYVSRHGDKKAKYMVCHGPVVLTEFISEEAAIKYAEQYITKELKIELLRKTIGDDECDFVYAYDTSYIVSNWVYIREIKYDEN